MFSKLLRRTHMYLALFLGPWVLMYAVSTFVMNHRMWFRGETPPPPRWVKVSSSVYPGEFPSGAGSGTMAKQLLDSLGIDGSHQASLREGKLTIVRHRTVQPIRVTYSASDRLLTVERQEYDSAAFLERMHRRRGFLHPYFLEDAWALTVDLFIAAMLFWILSGLWMWWELKPTRRWGAWSFVGGAALFALFLGVL